MILTKKKIKILILISCFIFILRNGDRLINEYEKYGYNPLKDITYNISKNDLREYDRINVVINKYNNCLLNNSLKSCFDKNEIKVKRYGNNYIFYK